MTVLRPKMGLGGALNQGIVRCVPPGGLRKRESTALPFPASGGCPAALRWWSLASEQASDSSLSFSYSNSSATDSFVYLFHI